MVDIAGETVRIVNQINFPDIIQEVSDAAYLHGKGEDAFYVCNLGNVIKKHQLWLHKLPRVEPFYAIKCNPNPLIVKMLSKMQVGFDCASKTEMSQVLDIGVSPERIIYAHPCKQNSHIKYAASNGVNMMTFDSGVELVKIHQYHPSAKLVLRLFVGTTQARCPLGLKFGANVFDVPKLLQIALSLDLDVIGVSFHVGSGCFDATAYHTAITLAKEVFSISSTFGINLTLLDIGGGFPGNFDTQENLSLFDDVCSTINSCISEYFPDKNIRIIAEPGRYYVSSAFQLACTITSRRLGAENKGTEQLEVQNCFLNDGLYGSFNCVVFDHYIGDHYLLNDCNSSVSSDKEYKTVLWGPTCDSADKISDNITMRAVSVGERIVFKNMGAYTVAAGSNFNGFPLPYIQYVTSESSWRLVVALLQQSYSSESDSLDNIDSGVEPIIVEASDSYNDYV